jgi:hypothetical protein
MYKLALLAFVASQSACAARLAGAPPDRSTHFEWLRKQEIVHHVQYGRLPRTATDASTMDHEPIARPVRPKTSATTKLEYFPMAFRSLAGDRICFERTFADDGATSPEAMVTRLADKWAFVATTHASVEEAGRSNDWPEPASVAPHTVTLKQDSRWHKEEKVAEICVAAPSLAPPANVLVLTSLARERPATNFVLIWELE